MLRHWAFKSDLPRIIEKGLIPGSVLGVDRKYDKGTVSFEKDPPTDWLGSNIGGLRLIPRQDPTFPLDFDEERLRADFEVIDRPNEVDGDLVLLKKLFKSPEERRRYVGDYVKVLPKPEAPYIPLTYLTSETKKKLRREGYDI